MPSLVRPTIVRYTLNGRRVPAGTPGAVKTKHYARLWYGVGLPGLPAAKRVPLAADKAAARRMLDDIVRAAERGRAGLPDADAARTPLADLLPRFAADLAAGVAGRGRRGRAAPSAEQAALVTQRVRDACSGCRFVMSGDLGRGAAGELSRYLAARRGKKRTRRGGPESGVSARTAEHVVAAMRRFAWWLRHRANAPVAEDVFDACPSFDADANPEHARRAATAAELHRLLDAVAVGGVRFKLTGLQRHRLYLAAFSTGLRLVELSRLVVGSFDLDADPPTVGLPKKLTKNRKGVVRQPLPAAVVTAFREFLKGRPPTEPVWPTGLWSHYGARMLRGDLTAAGIAYRVQTPDGPKVLDFHALRHSFVTLLAESGASPAELQRLARHADPRTTLNVYTHLADASLTAAVDRLPVPGGSKRFSREELERLVVLLAAVVGATLSPPERP